MPRRFPSPRPKPLPKPKPTPAPIPQPAPSPTPPVPIPQPQPVPPPPAPQSQVQEYWYSDPMYPNLKGQEPIRSAPLNLKVAGFSGGGHALGTPAAQAAACQIGLSNSLIYVNQRLKKPLKGWASTPLLNVNPRAGRDLNAYYDRRGLKFFYKEASGGNIVYTSESSPVVVHELGHAILDALRPDFWNTQSLEINAFHEAFGDCNALIHLTMYDPVIHFALEQTGGNLRQSNVLSQLALEMGSAIYGGRTPLRDAYNSFVYARPESLPDRVPHNKLGREPHNFSRVWTGTFYLVIVSIYEKLLTQGWDRMSALKNATDIGARYLLQGIVAAPNTPRYFDALAHAMLAVDASEGSPYQDVLVAVFASRGVMESRMMAANMLNPSDVGGDHVVDEGDVVVKLVTNQKTIRLIDEVEVIALDSNPLYGVEIEVAADKYYLFASGSLVDVVEQDDSEVIGAAMSSVDHIHKNDLVGEDKPWRVEDGKLVRNYYDCDGTFINNALIKGAPEFGKPWKAENNAGCCFGCHKKPKDPPAAPVKLGCVIREQSCQLTRATSCQPVRHRGC